MFRNAVRSRLEPLPTEQYLSKNSHARRIDTHNQCEVRRLPKVMLVLVDAKHKHDLEQYDHHPTKYGDALEEVSSPIKGERSV